MVVLTIRKAAWVLAATFTVAAAPLLAQVKVVESTPVGRTLAQANTSSMSNAGGEIFSRMQQLEQEVLELRGIVEQQTYEIKRLKQQRLDDYTDLDQRISSLMSQSRSSSSSTSTPATDATVNRTPSNTSPASSAAGKPLSERELYSDALNLLLQEKDFDGAAVKLNQYLRVFPSGLFVPNAYYWLGEISLSKQDLNDSKQWFSKLLAEYPDHNKAPDAKFKLGKLFFQQGDQGQAKSLLSEVANGSSSAAQLAKEFIAVNGL